MSAATAAAGRPRPRPARSCAQRAARDQDRLAARADPLPQRPPADRHLARAAAAVPVRARRRACSSSSRAGTARRRPARRSSIPGVLCMAVMFTAMFSAASIVWDREFGFLREMMVAPVRRSSIVIGKCLGGATVASLPGRDRDLRSPALVHVPYDPLLLLGDLRRCSCCSRSAITAFGVMVAVADQADAVVHGRDADGRDADVLPLRRAVPGRRACRRWLGVPQPHRPADLRGRPDAPARLLAPRHQRAARGARSTPASPGGAGACRPLLEAAMVAGARPRCCWAIAIWEFSATE